jgi:uncharacterized membrane protein YeaQ/YmgE (transglycosylase-associated protein family)
MTATVVGFIIFILIGLVAGWLASKLMSGGGYGPIADTLIGIIGAVIGGWLFSLLGIAAGGGLIGALVTATIGAILLLFVVRLLKRV